MSAICITRRRDLARPRMSAARARRTGEVICRSTKSKILAKKAEGVPDWDMVIRLPSALVRIDFDFLKKIRRWSGTILLARSQETFAMVGWSTGTRVVAVDVAIAHRGPETL